jgi:hypothetical protein
MGLENPIVPVDNVAGRSLAAGNSARSTISVLNPQHHRKEEALVIPAFDIDLFLKNLSI